MSAYESFLPLSSRAWSSGWSAFWRLATIVVAILWGILACSPEGSAVALCDLSFHWALRVFVDLFVALWLWSKIVLLMPRCIRHPYFAWRRFVRTEG